MHNVHNMMICACRVFALRVTVKAAATSLVMALEQELSKKTPASRWHNRSSMMFQSADVSKGASRLDWFACHMTNPQTKNLDFRGFDSSRFLSPRCGFLLTKLEYPNSSGFLVLWILSACTGRIAVLSRRCERYASKPPPRSVMKGALSLGGGGHGPGRGARPGGRRRCVAAACPAACPSRGRLAGLPPLAPRPGWSRPARAFGCSSASKPSAAR